MYVSDQPAGLTAAQKIRLRLVELAGETMAWRPTSLDQHQGYVDMVTSLASLLAPYVEHGPDEAAACPDPALHEDSGIQDFYRQITNLEALVAAEREQVEELERERDDCDALRTELMEAHAALEASRARIERVRAYLDDIRDPIGRKAMTTIRAILAGDPADGVPTSDEEDRG
jgi:hypothetical protein